MKVCTRCGKAGKKMAIIRTFDVCQDCFNKIKLDNQGRIKKGLNIPKKLETLQEEKNYKEQLKQMRRTRGI